MAGVGVAVGQGEGGVAAGERPALPELWLPGRARGWSAQGPVGVVDAGDEGGVEGLVIKGRSQRCLLRPQNLALGR